MGTFAAVQQRLIDVRAPAEYQKGHLPHSINLPILNDDERARVGTTYKQVGNAAATALGHRLVSGQVKAARLQQWIDAARGHQVLVMCWRGGARSQLAQTWLRDAGITVERVAGGYKTLRRQCLQALETATQTKAWWVIGGRTGVAKTVLINQLPQSIDLEGYANHRGSAFGGHVEEQPGQATFENALAYQCVVHPSNLLYVEDESRTIGRLGLPESWLAPMRSAPIALVEADLDTRCRHIYDEYVGEPLACGRDPRALQAQYQQALQRISRRLGGLRYTRISQLLDNAFAGRGTHEAWISNLLTQYYDPMYDYQLSKKKLRIKFAGNFDDVKGFLLDLAAQRGSNQH